MPKQTQAAEPSGRRRPTRRPSDHGRHNPPAGTGYGGPNNRDPILDTGIPGVILSRSIKRGRKILVVSAAYTIKSVKGTPKPTMRYVGSVRESIYQRNPGKAQERFSKALRQAWAIRRYADQFYANDEYPTYRLHIKDVPQDIVDNTPEPPHIDLRALFGTYEAPTVTQSEPIDDITDPEHLAIRLQGRSLGLPTPAVTLNGHTLTFHSLFVGGRRVYVPEQLGRGRDHWWLTVHTKDGPILDEIYDADHGEDRMASLTDAWLYLISLLRAHRPPTY